MTEDFEDSPEENREHPMDAEEHTALLRHNQTLKAVFKNLEIRPKDRTDRFPAWVYEALADSMTFSVIKLSYQNRNPESIEDYYKRQGMIAAYENMALFYSEQALSRREAEKESGS